MKRISLFTLTVLFAVLLIVPVEAKTGTKAWLNGYIVDENVPIFQESGKTYIPMDKVGEYYGSYVRRKPDINGLLIFKASALDSGDVLVLEQGSKVSTDESEQITARYSEAPRVINGYYYQTLQDASRALDKKITYDKANNTLVLSQDYYPGKQPSKINIVVDGKRVPPNFKPFVQSSRTMVPVRFITEAIGGQVYWHNKLTKGMQGLTVYKNDMDESGLTMYLNRCGAHVSGEYFRNDTFPTLRSGTTYVPLRFVADYLGLNVLWDQQSKTVFLSSGGTSNMSKYADQAMRERLLEIYRSDPEEIALGFD